MCPQNVKMPTISEAKDAPADAALYKAGPHALPSPLSSVTASRRARGLCLAAARRAPPPSPSPPPFRERPSAQPGPVRGWVSINSRNEG